MEAHLAEVQAPADTTELQAALRTAAAQRDAARSTKCGNWKPRLDTPLPAAEVVFLPSLPRRVDRVDVSRGEMIEGPALQVSGSDLVVVASLEAADRQLVTADMAVVAETGGERVEGRITEVRRGSESGTAVDAAGTGDDADAPSEGGPEAAAFEVVVALHGLTAAQVEMLRDTNVKVTIPVSATAGPVLVVPLAALTATAGGESRVRGTARRRADRHGAGGGGPLGRRVCRDQTTRCRRRGGRPGRRGQVDVNGATTPVVELHGIGRSFAGPPEVHAVRDVDLVVDQGAYVSIVGPSGSGKSTLLHLLGLLDRPTAGRYRLDGIDTGTMSERETHALARAARIGFVFQSFHLLVPRTVVGERRAGDGVHGGRATRSAPSAARVRARVGRARSSHRVLAGDPFRR